jgi:hypothetical protein
MSATAVTLGVQSEHRLGGIMAHGDVRIGKSQIESVITRRSAEQHGLKKWRQG